MPGLFGIVPATPDISEGLQSVFRELPGVWEGFSHGRALFGVAPRDATTAVHTLHDNAIIMVDGDAPFVRSFAEPGARSPLPFQLASGELRLTAPGVGNLVHWDGTCLRMVSDWTGTVPLYFARVDDGILFSSYLRPMARALDSPLDRTGILQFLRDGFTIGSRTPFEGIHRLLGGQSLTFETGGVLRVSEGSRAWSGIDPALADPDEATRAALAVLQEVSRGLTSDWDDLALMMSGGWDSRTLLADLTPPPSGARIRGYSHGDLQSREIRLTRDLCQHAGIPWQGEPLDDRLYDPTFLESAFGATENVVFPHWHRAGQVLEAGGCEMVTAGVFGEMLGGRYWTAHTYGGIEKATLLFGTLLGRGRPRPVLADEVRRLAQEPFLPAEWSSPWFADPDFADQGARSTAMEETRYDVEAAFRRYEARGVETVDQYAEAFQGEHIGSRFCNVQLLSTRGHLPVAFPLADRRLLEVVTRTPIEAKLQNRLNRGILRRIGPDLLRFPVGSTIVPASAPLVVQEASKVIRKVAVGTQQTLHRRSGSRLPAPRFSWPNYGFLGSGVALRSIVENLQAPLWNRPDLERVIRDVQTGRWIRDPLTLSNEMARMITLDLLVR